MKELVIPILVFALFAYLLCFWFWCSAFCASQNPFGKYTLYRKTIGGKEFYYAKVRVCRIFPIYRVFRAIDGRVRGFANASTIRKQFLWLDKKSLIERLNYEYEEESNRKKVKKELKSKGKRIHA